MQGDSLSTGPEAPECFPTRLVASIILGSTTMGATFAMTALGYTPFLGLLGFSCGLVAVVLGIIALRERFGIRSV